ncbi:hypothetical protein PENTCL1PPCAC_29236, partial [Pristionchus entomophagus]
AGTRGNSVPDRYDLLDRDRYYLVNGFFDTHVSMRAGRQRYSEVQDPTDASRDAIEEETDHNPVFSAVMIISIVIIFTIRQ